jgi:thiol-disulfide isomerase/thioredoxin
MSEENKNQQFLLGLFGGIATVSVIGMIILGIVFITSNGDGGGSVAGDQNQPQGQNNPVPTPIAPNPASVAGVSTYSEKEGADICREDGLPVVYLFSTTWCPHCTWINDTFNNTVQKYVDAGKIKAYHWEVDINDDVLTSEKESVVPASHLAIYNEFNPKGSIPTFVFGCKYYRIGNGYEQANDLDAEAAEFEALIEDIIK